MEAGSGPCCSQYLVQPIHVARQHDERRPIVPGERFDRRDLSIGSEDQDPGAEHQGVSQQRFIADARLLAFQQQVGRAQCPQRVARILTLRWKGYLKPRELDGGSDERTYERVSRDDERSREGRAITVRGHVRGKP